MRQRILLIRLSAIGDVINTLPAVGLLRKHLPEAHLAFVVEDRASDVVVGHPDLDQVIVFPRRRWRAFAHSPRQWWQLVGDAVAYARQFRRQGFEVALDFQGNLKGAIHSVLSGAPRRIGFARGFARERADWFANEHVEPPLDRPHRVDKFASLLRPLGVNAGPLRYVLPPSPEAIVKIDDHLRRHGLHTGSFVIVHPGTSERGAAKRWPTDRFAELARRIVGELATQVVVTFGPGEERLADELLASCGSGVFPGPREGSLLELAELIRRAAAFVSADTGPMHLAAACGTTCVALFGPKDPAVYRPYGDGHIVIHRRDANGVGGMLQISVDEVLAAVRSALEKARTAPPPRSARLP